MSDERAALLFKAHLAEKAERYDEMTSFMKEIAKLGTDLTTEERNLLSVAFKNAAGTRRASWRVISSLEDRQRKKENVPGLAAAEVYRGDIEKELREICENVLHLVDESLLQMAETPESKVFYEKMKGDYWRYVAEFEKDESRKAAGEKGQEAYEKAVEIAKESLTPTNPIRLGLALNYSVFNFEILEKPDVACKMAQEAFDLAIPDLDQGSTAEDYRDATLIMQLLVRVQKFSETAINQPRPPVLPCVEANEMQDKGQSVAVDG